MSQEEAEPGGVVVKATEGVNGTWTCSAEESSGVWGTECWESGVRDWGDLAESLVTSNVTDPINCCAAKREGMLGGGVGDARISDDDWDSITQSEERGIALFIRPKRVRGANALQG